MNDNSELYYEFLKFRSRVYIIEEINSTLTEINIFGVCAHTFLDCDTKYCNIGTV